MRECEELGAVLWVWQTADGVMGKSRFDGAKRGQNLIDRSKMRTKKSILVDQEGGPPGVAIDRANVHDTKLLAATIDAVVISHPDLATVVQNLCLDKGCDNPFDGPPRTTQRGQAYAQVALRSPTFPGAVWPRARWCDVGTDWLVSSSAMERRTAYRSVQALSGRRDWLPGHERPLWPRTSSASSGVVRSLRGRDVLL